MPDMGFKIKDMLSMYKFERGSTRPSAHYTVVDPSQVSEDVVVDLWDIRGSLKKHKAALAENAEAFFSMCSEEMFVAMYVNSTLTPDILGRIYAVRQMLASPEEMEPLVDDPDFLLYVGTQEYARLKPLYDKMGGSSGA